MKPSPEFNLRKEDDHTRLRLFANLKNARHDPFAEKVALEQTEKVLGPKNQWLRPLQRYLYDSPPRLVLIPTWQCELRCRYCAIPKQDGRVMPVETAFRAVELLMSSQRSKLTLQFFGGEALLEWKTVQKTIEYASKLAQHNNQIIDFILSSNGMKINAETLKFLKDYDVKLELSLDGLPETQRKFRPAIRRRDSYLEGHATQYDLVERSGVRHEILMVVHPQNASIFDKNFEHIASLGWRNIHAMFGQGFLWSKEQMVDFSKSLLRVSDFLNQQWNYGESTILTNLQTEPMTMRLNGEVTVDWDGTIHAGNAFLQETPKSHLLQLGHLDDAKGFDRYWLDMPENEMLLDCTYGSEITRNNLAVGDIYTSYIRWMRKQGIPKHLLIA